MSVPQRRHFYATIGKDTYALIEAAINTFSFISLSS
jgi:hypothetical protein